MSDKPSGFVAALVKDPAQPPTTKLFTGFVGESAKPKHMRVYLDPELASHVDIPEGAILHRAEAKDATGLGAHHVWVDAKQLAEIDLGDVHKFIPASPVLPACPTPPPSNFGPGCLTQVPHCPTSLPPTCPTSFTPACPTQSGPACFSAAGPFCPTQGAPSCPTSHPNLCPTQSSPLCPTNGQPFCPVPSKFGPQCPTGNSVFCPTGNSVICPTGGSPFCPAPTSVGPACQLITQNALMCGGVQTNPVICNPGPSAVDACPSAPGGCFDLTPQLTATPVATGLQVTPQYGIGATPAMGGYAGMLATPAFKAPGTIG